MCWKNTRDSYGVIAKGFHWLLFLLIIGLIPLGLYMTILENSPYKFNLYGWHKSIGILLLVLTLFRLLWFIFSPPPKIITGSTRPKIRIYLAHSVHIGLYVLMLTTPLLGWLASSATGFEMRLFELFDIPSLISEDPTLEKWFFGLHKISAALLIALSVLHLAGAFYHHLIDKDDTLRRMLP